MYIRYDVYMHDVRMYSVCMYDMYMYDVHAACVYASCDYVCCIFYTIRMYGWIYFVLTGIQECGTCALRNVAFWDDDYIRSPLLLPWGRQLTRFSSTNYY